MWRATPPLLPPQRGDKRPQRGHRVVVTRVEKRELGRETKATRASIRKRLRTTKHKKVCRLCAFFPTCDSIGVCMDECVFKWWKRREKKRKKKHSEDDKFAAS